MARTPSKILTTAEKKTQLKGFKDDLKVLKAAHKPLADARKVLDKTYKDALKALNTQYAADTKVSDKALAEAQKNIDLMTARINDLTADLAVPA